VKSIQQLPQLIRVAQFNENNAEQDDIKQYGLSRKCKMAAIKPEPVVSRVQQQSTADFRRMGRPEFLLYCLQNVTLTAHHRAFSVSVNVVACRYYGLQCGRWRTRTHARTHTHTHTLPVQPLAVCLYRNFLLEGHHTGCYFVFQPTHEDVRVWLTPYGGPLSSQLCPDI
jgi:hypothetical protein